MIKKIVNINKDKCIGCGLCVSACHEGAIGIKDNKATLLREDYCDGLGNCLPVCPMDAISLSEKEVPNIVDHTKKRQWPIQIKLVPVNASFFNKADLLIAADCSAFAYPDFHKEFKDKVIVIGCPKLDATDFSQKLSEIISLNNVKSITVARMVVPCCGGLEVATKKALQISQKDIPLNIKVINT